ncbi:MAG TPA: hypothetical protein VFQ13_02145 [Anaerolineales bacterium]|nr:hypothetical protein [Anaerolineales bacterium]
MNTQFTEKPTLVNVIAWMTLASGIINLIWGLVAVAGFWWTIICIPFLILPTILGIFEIIYAAKLISNPPQTVQPSTNIAIFEILCILAGNVFSVVVGILALVFYNDVTVRDYFARLNGLPPVTPLVPPVPPVEPTAPAEPEAPPTAPEEVAPVPPEPSPAAPEDIIPEPAPPETPEKPKRSRKVAGK